MKSIIGYYSPPLNKEERDICLAYLTDVANQCFTSEILSKIKRNIRLVWDKYSGESMQQPSVFFQMDSAMKDLMEELRLQYPRTPEIKTLTVVFKPSSPNSCHTAMSKELRDLFEDRAVLRSPGNPDIDRNDNDEYICDKYNHYLSTNPDKRVFEKTPLAIEVDRHNTSVLERLQRFGYESQTNATIYDVSDVILDILKSRDK